MPRTLLLTILLMLPVATAPFSAAPPPLRRNVLWNQFSASSHDSWDDLHEVELYLKAHAWEDPLQELDASTVLAIDRALVRRANEDTTLRALRADLVGPSR